jgi:hypothetical protein
MDGAGMKFVALRFGKEFLGSSAHDFAPCMALAAC